MPAPVSSSRLSRLLESHAEQLTSELERFFQETRDRERREVADQLNQMVRRIRQAPDPAELAATTADAAAAFSGGAAFLRIDGEIARCEGVRGVAEEDAAKWREAEIPLASAAALKGAADSRDAVVAAAASSEISPELAALSGASEDERISIFPVVSGDRTVALLYAWGTVQRSAVELLALVAAGVWSEIVKPEPPPEPPQLVQIVPVEAPAPASAPATSWDQLSPEDQRIHLRAQRFARVRVAEIRLQEAETVQSGRKRRNLYEVLRTRIDAARDTFRQAFFTCPSMVDYLHLELVRNLANDDAELLGADYPGPLV
jgi:hypothetical protein